MTPARSIHEWVLFPKPQTEAKLRLLCLPYAGGGASLFNSWADFFPASVEICAVQLPGHESKRSEPAFTELTSLIALLTKVLQPFLGTRFALFGHSMGALLSFELARRFRRELKLAPSLLIVSGQRAPQLRDPVPPTHLLPDEEFVDRLKQMGGTPEGVLESSELMELFLPLLRSDFQLCETYVYSPDDPLECPISAFGGVEDVRVSEPELAAWSVQTRGRFDLRMFPGKHFFLNSSRGMFLRALSQRLEEELR